MPQMGESIFEGTITKWLKKAGDPVEKDEPLFEISTDKVDAEIPAPVAGILTEIKIPEGATVQINTVVAVIGGTSDPAASDLISVPAAAKPQLAPQAPLAAPQVPPAHRPPPALLPPRPPHRAREQPRPRPHPRQPAPKAASPKTTSSATSAPTAPAHRGSIRHTNGSKTRATGTAGRTAGAAVGPAAGVVPLTQKCAPSSPSAWSRACRSLPMSTSSTKST